MFLNLTSQKHFKGNDEDKYNKSRLKKAKNINFFTKIAVNQP